MTIAEIIRRAEEFDMPAASALLARSRFLRQRMRMQQQIIDAYTDYVGSDQDEEFARCMAWYANDTFMEDARELRAVCVKISGIIREGQITDEMIAKARAYPIDRLIQFQRGYATAWCHNDKRPSLTWDAKRNRAKCWPCDKSFDPIGVLRERDGLSFQDAVRRLQ